MDAKELVDTLRVAVDVNMSDEATQILYEQWFKRDEWAARSQAIPLLVGVDPECWPQYLNDYDLVEAEQALWNVYSTTFGGSSNDPDRIEPRRLRTWAASSGITAPVCFDRLSDFISRVVLGGTQVPDPTTSADAHATLAHLQEKEIVLGAALSLVTKMPAECRDEHGFFDGLRIARLIGQKAVLWFADIQPGLSQEEMAALIDKWLE